MANKNYGWAFPAMFGLVTMIFIALLIWSASNIPGDVVFYKNCSVSEPILIEGKLFARLIPPNVTTEVRTFPFNDGKECWFFGTII